MARAKSISLISGWEPDVNYRRWGIQRWALLTDTIIKIVLTDGRIIVLKIPAGFQWDGASVPKLARWYAKPESFLLEALFHDWGYMFHWFWTLEADNKWVKRKVSKWFVDDLFHDLLGLYAGIRVTKADVMWAMVGVGGWFAWIGGTCNMKCQVCPCNAGDWCPENLFTQAAAPRPPKWNFPKMLPLLLLPFVGGCGLTGERTWDWGITSPVLSVNCKTTMKGTYVRPSMANGLPAPTPEERADALVPIIRQAIIDASKKEK